ncbi:MAG: hypothetical protein NTY15_06555 [Planctomycetota bacterium]|nr:hypothetical protein [Planctomycetota bacterium]
MYYSSLGSVAFLGLLFFDVCFSVAPATAGLILNPAGTVVIEASPIPLEARVKLTSGLVSGVEGFAGRYFGETKGDIYVSENGHLVFAAGEADFPVPLGSSQASIAPLWDDYLLIQSTVSQPVNNAVLADYSSGHYLAVTWQNVRLEVETVAGEEFPDTNRSTQVVWFEGDTMIRGFEFKKDDIAFGYVPHTSGADFGDIAAVAGLDKGDGTFSAIQGTTDGSLSASQGNLLAPGENNFLLFRPGVAGSVPNNFTADSFQGGYYRGAFSLTAVPEPSSLGLCFVSVAIAVGFAIRRKISSFSCS